MTYTMITPSHNCDDGYIALANIELANVPKTIAVGPYSLTKTSEFHVSLMALKHLAPIINPENPTQAVAQLVDDFVQFTKSIPLTTLELTTEFRIVRRAERVSVVVMIEVPGIDALFDTLRSKYSPTLPTQPTHITLYTLQPNTGIGLFSTDEVARDTQVVTVPELSDIKMEEAP
ncbi:MAG: hypothetical protein WBB39_02260 [Candidatus Saccharimonadales bacterium]